MTRTTRSRASTTRRVVHVDRQLVSIAGRSPFLAPPKTAASVRSIPLPTVVIDALAAHLANYPAGVDGFVFAPGGKPIRRTTFGSVWRAALKAADAPTGAGSMSCGTTTPAC
jgi:hypothetical protein